MPLRYSVHPERRCVVVACSGRVQLVDVLGYIHALARDPAFRPGMDELIDYSGAESYDLSPGDVYQVIDADNRYRPSLRIGRTAFVAPQDHVYGMIRMYEMLSDVETGAIRVFRSLAEACRWLEIELDTALYEKTEEEEDG